MTCDAINADSLQIWHRVRNE